MKKTTKKTSKAAQEALMAELHECKKKKDIDPLRLIVGTSMRKHLTKDAIDLILDICLDKEILSDPNEEALFIVSELIPEKNCPQYIVDKVCTYASSIDVSDRRLLHTALGVLVYMLQSSDALATFVSLIVKSARSPTASVSLEVVLDTLYDYFVFVNDSTLDKLLCTALATANDDQKATQALMDSFVVHSHVINDSPEISNKVIDYISHNPSASGFVALFEFLTSANIDIVTKAIFSADEACLRFITRESDHFNSREVREIALRIAENPNMSRPVLLELISYLPLTKKAVDALLARNDSEINAKLLSSGNISAKQFDKMADEKLKMFIEERS